VKEIERLRYTHILESSERRTSQDCEQKRVSRSTYVLESAAVGRSNSGQRTNVRVNGTHALESAEGERSKGEKRKQARKWHLLPGELRGRVKLGQQKKEAGEGHTRAAEYGGRIMSQQW
jgi:hypothetical protein